jgi:hypothetical protein
MQQKGKKVKVLELKYFIWFISFIFFIEFIIFFPKSKNILLDLKQNFWGIW